MTGYASTAAGDLTYLGRGDNQVKIRGFRVELGEIEHALRAHPSVVDAAVVVDARDAEADRLIAYVAAMPTVPSAELRGLLEQQLPAFMVPAAFVTMTQLPRLASGKIDRSALPEPDDAEHERAGVELPASATERQLHEIWTDVLSVETLSVTDDFFYVGGHSLLATRIMARARTTFGVELPLHLIFSHTTVRDMSTEIDKRVAATAGDRSIDDMLASLENMDEDEARRMLERELDRLPRNE